jgi:hypothetical protein
MLALSYQRSAISQLASLLTADCVSVGKNRSSRGRELRYTCWLATGDLLLASDF